MEKAKAHFKRMVRLLQLYYRLSARVCVNNEDTLSYGWLVLCCCCEIVAIIL